MITGKALEQSEISLGCESLWKCCEAVALQAGSLTDLPPRTEANSSPEIWRSHTQQGPPGGPYFYAAQQTAPRAQSFQIRAHRCRRGQPLQRSWASDFTKFWWSCEGFSDNIQAVAVEMASNAAGWPRAQINGRCHKRNGQAQNIYLTRARWNSPRPGHCWTFQPHPGWALVQAPVRRRNATSWGAAVHCLGWKTSWSCFGFEQRGDKPYRHETRRRHQRKSCLCKAINTLFQACWRKRKITPLPCPSSLSLPTWRAWRGCKTGHRPNLVFECLQHWKIFHQTMFFLARLDFFPPPLTAPGSPRMVLYFWYTFLCWRTQRHHGSRYSRRVQCDTQVKPEEEVARSFNVDNIFSALLFFYCESRFRGVQSPIGGGDG